MISAPPGASRTRSPLRQVSDLAARRAARERRVLGQMQRLAMHRHDDLRLHPVEQVGELVAARMAGDVDQMGAVGDDLDALVDQPVDRRGRRFSLPGMVREEKITRSPRRECDVGMLVGGDARQRRARLALAAGAERHHLVGRQIAVGVDRAERRDAVEIAGLARDLDDPLHGAADHHDLAVAGRAASATARRRATLEAKVVTATRPARSGSVRRGSWRHRPPTASGRRAPHWWNRRPARGSPPRRARAAWLRRSAGRRTGVGSIFQSPVCSTVPSGVRMTSAFDSGIECAIDTSSMSNGPSVKRPPSGTMVTGISGAPGSLARLASQQRGGERRGVDRQLAAAATGRAARRNGPHARG